MLEEIFVRLNANELLTRPRQEREPLWGKVFCKGEIIVIIGESGLGKTEFVTSLCFALMTGMSFLKFACPYPRKIGYVDTELGPDLMAAKIERTMGAYPGMEFPGDSFDLLTPSRDDREFFHPNISTKEGRKFYAEFLRHNDVLVIDGWLNVDRKVDRFDDPEMRWHQNFQFLKRLAQRGRSIIIIHHLNKAGQMYGQSQMFNGVDAQLVLSRSPVAIKDEAQRMVLTFKKARSFFYPDNTPLSITRHPGGNWTWSELSEELGAECRKLASQKVSQRKICEILGLTPIEVARFCEELNAGAASRSKKETDHDNFAMEELF